MISSDEMPSWIAFVSILTELALFHISEVSYRFPNSGALMASFDRMRTPRAATCLGQRPTAPVSRLASDEHDKLQTMMTHNDRVSLGFLRPEVSDALSLCFCGARLRCVVRRRLAMTGYLLRTTLATTLPWSFTYFITHCSFLSLVPPNSGACTLHPRRSTTRPFPRTQHGQLRTPQAGALPSSLLLLLLAHALRLPSLSLSAEALSVPSRRDTEHVSFSSVARQTSPPAPSFFVRPAANPGRETAIHRVGAYWALTQSQFDTGHRGKPSFVRSEYVCGDVAVGITLTVS